MLIQLLANGIIMGSIYSLVALGFALVYNTTRIFHIAYAAIYMFSAYIILSFYKNLQLPLLLAFLIAIFFTIGLSLLIERTVYLPLAKRKSSLNVVLISSLGIMIVLVNIIAMFYGNEIQILNPNISKSVTFRDIILTYTQLAQLFVSLVLMVMFLIFLKYSKFGIKTRAMRDDEVLCTVFGMDINRMRLILFGLSAFFAAVGSGLVAYDVGMDPYIGMPMLLNAVVALIIGGVGRFEAPILGGFIIGILQSLAVWTFSSRWQDAVTFTLLIIFLLVRPQGLLGEKQRVV
ncbi:branched-chain amino acid ABC transporter permease [candidate division KSB1 bacterium]|nr:branched-chain amino acid ABC transporter permease [candidate division KSB1 bacterium]